MVLSVVNLLLVMLLSGGSCKRWTGGFNAGVESRLDLTMGTAGTLRRDDVGGFVVAGDGDAALGATWKGGAFGGGYGSVNDKYYGANGVVAAQLGGVLQPSIRTKFGKNGEGNWVRELKPKMEVINDAKFDGNGQILSGDDAMNLAALYGDQKARKDTQTKKSTSTPVSK